MSSFHGNAAAGADNNNNSNKENTPDLLPDPRKATPFMLKSLGQLHDTLLCPLCHKMMREPSTLACAHTFCLQCIKDYSCNQSICPGKTLENHEHGQLLYRIHKCFVEYLFILIVSFNCFMPFFSERMWDSPFCHWIQKGVVSENKSIHRNSGN